MDILKEFETRGTPGVVEFLAVFLPLFEERLAALEEQVFRSQPPEKEEEEANG